MGRCFSQFLHSTLLCSTKHRVAAGDRIGLRGLPRHVGLCGQIRPEVGRAGFSWWLRHRTCPPPGLIDLSQMHCLPVLPFLSSLFYPLCQVYLLQLASIASLAYIRRLCPSCWLPAPRLLSFWGSRRGWNLSSATLPCDPSD